MSVLVGAIGAAALWFVVRELSNHARSVLPQEVKQTAGAEVRVVTAAEGIRGGVVGAEVPTKKIARKAKKKAKIRPEGRSRR